MFNHETPFIKDSQGRRTFLQRQIRYRFFFTTSGTIILNWNWYILLKQAEGSLSATAFTFKNNDLILIGANLPHLWRCDEKFW